MNSNGRISKIVLTGGLGHIGSKLMRELPLLFPDLELVVIDNMSTQRYSSLFQLPKEGRFRFIEGDILKDDLHPYFAGADVVVHLAAITNAAGSFEIREKLEFENFEGTKRVADACIVAGTPLVNISSTSVYGTQSDLVDEDCTEDELKPQSPYAETKLKEERHLADLSHSRGLKFVTCRFGTIFGISPGMRFHTAVNKFCWQAVMGQPITVWSTAYDQLRPYLDLKDAVRALQFIIEKRLYDGRVYNVLTLNSTVREMVEAIKLHVPNLRVAYVDTPIMNQLSYNVDNSRFRKLGFQFQGDIKQGIAETIQLLSQCTSASK